MLNHPIHVLLLEDNPGDARLLEVMLRDDPDAQFLFHTVETVQDALQWMAAQDTDVILADLFVRDSSGFETFHRLREGSVDIPVIVLSGLNDSELAVRAVRAGAQDYLIKGQVEGQLLSRSLRYAIERHQLQAAVRSLLLVDELTKLYNRRGFVTLAEQQLKQARRTHRDVKLVFMDMNGLKRINDTFGHDAGDRAIQALAEILRATFRESDVLARIGGDEFVALTPHAALDSPDAIRDRIRQNVTEWNAQGRESFQLSVSVGLSLCPSDAECCLEELLAEADQRMYRQKRMAQQPQSRTGTD